MGCSLLVIVVVLGFLWFCCRFSVVFMFFFVGFHVCFNDSFGFPLVFLIVPSYFFNFLGFQWLFILFLLAFIGFHYLLFDFHLFLLAFHLSWFLMFSLVVISFFFCFSLVFIVFCWSFFWFSIRDCGFHCFFCVVPFLLWFQIIVHLVCFGYHCFCASLVFFGFSVVFLWFSCFSSVVFNDFWRQSKFKHQNFGKLLSIIRPSVSMHQTTVLPYKMHLLGLKKRHAKFSPCSVFSSIKVPQKQQREK